jgi:hypothetical protein
MKSAQSPGWRDVYLCRPSSYSREKWCQPSRQPWRGDVHLCRLSNAAAKAGRFHSWPLGHVSVSGSAPTPGNCLCHSGTLQKCAEWCGTLEPSRSVRNGAALSSEPLQAVSCLHVLFTGGKLPSPCPTKLVPSGSDRSCYSFWLLALDDNFLF